MENERLMARVTGRVQGVGFRAYARDIARKRKLSGSVRNRDDGSVYLIAEGPREDLEALLLALRRGPSNGHVDQVEVTWTAPEGLSGSFEVWR